MQYNREPTPNAIQTNDELSTRLFHDACVMFIQLLLLLWKART